MVNVKMSGGWVRGLNQLPQRALRKKQMECVVMPSEIGIARSNRAPSTEVKP